MKNRPVAPSKLVRGTTYRAVFDGKMMYLKFLGTSPIGQPIYPIDKEASFLSPRSDDRWVFEDIDCNSFDFRKCFYSAKGGVDYKYVGVLAIGYLFDKKYIHDREDVLVLYSIEPSANKEEIAQ